MAPRITPRLLSPTSSQVAARTADMKQYMSLDPEMLLKLLQKRPMLQHPIPEHVLIPVSYTHLTLPTSDLV